MGLPISQNICHAMELSLEVESVVGEGSFFFLDVPIPRLGIENYNSFNPK